MTASTGITQRISQSKRSELEALVEIFADGIDAFGKFLAVGESDLPPTFAGLLAHHDHMTVTLEAYYESLVRVEVVVERPGTEWYARQSLLARHSDGAVVQFGIMRIDVSGLPTLVRSAIESHAAPLGRILIKNNLLRHVELRALWQIEPSRILAEPLRTRPGAVIYGRSAAIHLAGRRAVDLLEIVTDQPVAPVSKPD